MVACALLVQLALGASVPLDFTATVAVAGLGSPRSVVVDAAGALLVLERSPSRVTQIALPALTRVTLLNGAPFGLQHGLAVNGGFLYASSDTTVLRWPYVAGSAAPITATPTAVVSGMPSGGNHFTRTLAFDGAHAAFLATRSRAPLLLHSRIPLS